LIITPSPLFESSPIFPLSDPFYFNILLMISFVTLLGVC